MNKNLALIIVAGLLSCSVMAQRKTPSRQQPAPTATTDTTKPKPGSLMLQGGAKKGPQPYSSVITAKAKTMVGLFTVHKVDDKTYFEIPDSILNRDMLIVSRLAKAGVDMRSGGSMSGYAGDILNKSAVRFEKGPNDRIFMRDLSYSERSKDSTQEM